MPVDVLILFIIIFIIFIIISRQKKNYYGSDVMQHFLF